MSRPAASRAGEAVLMPRNDLHVFGSHRGGDGAGQRATS